MAWFDNFVRKYISEGYSLMAWDTSIDRMVGVAIFTQCKRKNYVLSLKNVALSGFIQTLQRRQRHSLL